MQVLIVLYVISFVRSLIIYNSVIRVIVFDVTFAAYRFSKKKFCLPQRLRLKHRFDIE